MYKSIILLLAGCLWLAAPALAQYAGYHLLANTDDFRQRFAKAAQATSTITCDFVQDKNLAMLSDKIVSKGKFWFKRDSKVRMEYQKPSYYLLVINGDQIKTKDGQKENQVSAKSNKLFEQVNKMMIDCVQGTALNNKSFSTRIFDGANDYMVELTPVVKSLQSIFKNISLTVDKKDYSVTRIKMEEQSGDNTVISFKNKQINRDIADDIFAVK